MITLLGIISFYLGVHWGFQQDAMRGSGVDASMACALLLARLDLVRLKVWPPSWLACIGFTSFIMFFISYGNALHLRLHAWPIIRHLLDAGVIGN